MRRIGIVMAVAAVAAFSCGTRPGPDGQQAAQGSQEVARLRSAVALEPETVLIEGGTFTMGTPSRDPPDPEYHHDEAPISVTVDSFRIGRTPVTAKEYCAFLNSEYAKALAAVGKNVYDQLVVVKIADRPTSITRTEEGTFAPRTAGERSPVYSATWVGAMHYCRWLSQETGREYRLPTEAEWEFAARGTEGRLWPWGNEAPDSTRGYRWTRKVWGQGKALVRSFPAGATAEGVLDMLAYPPGEWCVSLWKEARTARDVVDTNAHLEGLAGRSSEFRPSPEVVASITSFDEVDALLREFRAPPRVLRGPYDRIASRPSLVVSILAKQSTTHPGMVWTRVARDPLYEWGCFRVVEELPRTVPDAAGGVEAAPAKTD